MIVTFLYINFSCVSDVTAWLLPPLFLSRVVGPLPIREAANVYGYGNGASPRWNYLFQVPLPVAMLDAYLSNRVDSEKAAPLLGTPLVRHF